ncbi:hypothetical protein Tco_0879529 [Tanacetum coccineum]
MKVPVRVLFCIAPIGVREKFPIVALAEIFFPAVPTIRSSLLQLEKSVVGGRLATLPEKTIDDGCLMILPAIIPQGQSMNDEIFITSGTPMMNPVSTVHLSLNAVRVSLAFLTILVIDL